MAMNDFVPTSWNGEAVTNDKLNQMCNNTQYLFDRAPAMRYSVEGIVRDTQLKVISGKTPFGVDTTRNYDYVKVYFGSFFTAGCHPVVTCTVEATGGSMHRSHVVIQGLNGELDQTGFTAIVATEAYKTVATAGWVHWTAVGY